MDTFIKTPRPNCGARSEDQGMRHPLRGSEEINLYYMADREEAVLQ